MNPSQLTEYRHTVNQLTQSEGKKSSVQQGCKAIAVQSCPQLPTRGDLRESTLATRREVRAASTCGLGFEPRRRLQEHRRHDRRMNSSLPPPASQNKSARALMVELPPPSSQRRSAARMIQPPPPLLLLLSVSSTRGDPGGEWQHVGPNTDLLAWSAWASCIN